MGFIKVIIVVYIVFESDLSVVKVSLDGVIKLMWEIVKDMYYKYKEIFEGGLVVNVLVYLFEC